MPESLLELRSVTKTYPGVTALEDVSVSLGHGEILGLIGENGAGKSTLMKILGGIVAPTGGTIVLDGKSRDRLTVPAATAAGIAFVHQELNLFEISASRPTSISDASRVSADRCASSTPARSMRRSRPFCAGWGWR